MRIRTAVSLTASLALLTSAAPPPPAPTSPAASAGETRSPVRCRVGDGDGTRPMRWRKSTSQNYAVQTMPAPPPPPPPAVMTPPPIAAQSSQDVVVTGSFNRAPSMLVVPGPMRPHAPGPYGSPGNTERYAGEAVAAIRDTASAPVSTFSVDVDTGAYANVRRFLVSGQPVPAEAVRTEEMINYFRYDYPRPTDRATPFSITTDLARTPWNATTRLLRVGLRGYDIGTGNRPPANLVFLVDTSGSMNSEDKLPLVKLALQGLADQLRPDDRVAIVAYAGSAGIVLEPTSDKRHVAAALACLDAGGSTAGGEGIALAYATARAQFRKGGVNRIFLATDGDFNVGISDNRALEAMVARERDDGITLTTLGFGTGNYNEAMMERIADVGNGNYAYIDSAMEARKVLADELAATLVTIAKDVKVQVEFNPAAVSQYRLIGYENRALAEEDFTNDAVDAGDIGAGHQVTALYEIVPAGAAGWTPARRYAANRPEVPAAAGATNEIATVKLRFKRPDGGASREVARAIPAAALRDASDPTGDMAFVVAVAAFGQKLRGDKYLGSYSFADARRLAGHADGYWRQEFLKLTELAGTGARGDDGGTGSGGAGGGD
ncbi:MAG TPA: VWA domain-containing protein [Sphingomonas sp.]|nr:VWA domain-containing protein [Sphingomonas sp.]